MPRQDIKEIISKTTSLDNIDSIANLVLDLALDLTGSKKGSVLLLGENNKLVIRSEKGLGPALAPTINIKIGDGICGSVAAEKRPLLVKDTKGHAGIPINKNGRYKTGSFISCPILIKEKLCGVINITYKTDNAPFTEEDLESVNILANQAALSLEHAYLVSELHLRSLELDRTNQVLYDSEKLKVEFMTKISHELRTPLNSITGAAYYLKEKKCSKEEQADFINIISDETVRLINLLQGLLNLPCFASEESLLKRRSLDLKDILQNAAASRTLRDTLAANSVSLNIVCPDKLPEITGEKIYLVQAFIYLIDGIVKYISAGDSIDLKAVHAEGSVGIEMSVKGKAIPESDIPFIFNERALWSGPDSNKDRLKFYLAKKYISLHKGSVSASNTRDGISISLSIPVNIRESRNAEIEELLSLFISFSAETMKLKRCSVMLLDEPTGKLKITSALGLPEEVIRETQVEPGDGIAGLAVLENTTLMIKDIEKDPRIGKRSEAKYNTKSFICMPVVINNKVAGVLNMSNKADNEPFNEKDLYLAGAITERMSTMIEKVRTGKLKVDKFKTVVGDMENLLSAKKLSRKDRDMSDLVFVIAKNMNCSEHETRLALYAASLYDLGLTRIDESILMKKGPLSGLEQKIIRTHPFPAAGLIRHIESDDKAEKCILHHHERYDGSGYPDGLKGDDIPLISRILSVADSYTAMITDRPYRKALSSKKASEEIKTASGKHFDPRIVDAFTRTV